MEKINPKRAIIVAAVLTYFGFYTVTQAGQPMPVFQNDGDAMLGGIALLLAGVLFGAALTLRKVSRKGVKSGKR
jgi:hypothetical protein